MLRCFEQTQKYIDGLEQKRHNSSVSALEVRFSCTNPSYMKMLFEVLLRSYKKKHKKDNVHIFN